MLATLAGLPNGTSYGAYAFAFANWGGSFYIFYYVDGLDDSTNVWGCIAPARVLVPCPYPCPFPCPKCRELGPLK